MLQGWSTDGWWTQIMSADGSVTIDCNVPAEKERIAKDRWDASLQHVLDSLVTFNKLGVEGQLAVSRAMNDAPELIIEHRGIREISYLQLNDELPVYTWPEPGEPDHFCHASARVSPDLPFYRHEWSALPVYHGNHAPVANVRFGIDDAVIVSRRKDKSIWLVLLEALVLEKGNDAILQKLAFVETFKDKSYQAHEQDHLLENAAGGGPYDWIMDDLIVTARKDVIAELPNHSELGNVLLTVDVDRFTTTQAATFQTPSPELLPVGRDIDRELMKYLRRFPQHVVHLPGDRFEKLVAEILASHGFSDIQLNVRNSFGEIDIIAFEGTKDGIRRGYIIECKRYRRDRKVTLREAHVLAMKRILMKSEGVDRAMLVTTSDFTAPTKKLYDSAWGMELKAHDQVAEWLRSYKVCRDGLYFQG